MLFLACDDDHYFENVVDKRLNSSHQHHENGMHDRGKNDTMLFSVCDVDKHKITIVLSYYMYTDITIRRGVSIQMLGMGHEHCE